MPPLPRGHQSKQAIYSSNFKGNRRGWERSSEVKDVPSLEVLGLFPTLQKGGGQEISLTVGLNGEWKYLLYGIFMTTPLTVGINHPEILPANS